MSEAMQFEAVKRTCEQMGISFEGFATALAGHLDRVQFEEDRADELAEAVKRTCEQMGISFEGFATALAGHLDRVQFEEDRADELAEAAKPKAE